ncbi:uncharacterized protein LOC124808482 [Hydra vulgaris]|uniref:uncharacterized protein LOC124808482 n=1 Tax=Hydra vulgaris TaxID=6087 RepID=UPI001F5E8926|nr:uncharacterized protein LOC124808482 [Hydra vulgaris]
MIARARFAKGVFSLFFVFSQITFCSDRKRGYFFLRVKRRLTGVVKLSTGVKELAGAASVGKAVAPTGFSSTTGSSFSSGFLTSMEVDSYGEYDIDSGQYGKYIAAYILTKLIILVSESNKDSKKRAENWTTEQLTLLIKLYNEKKQLLDGKLSPSISKFTKDDAWSKIADQVSLVGPDRTVHQCKKKLSDQKSDSKGKAARIIFSMNKTGGGEKCLEELNFIDQQMVSKMPKVSYIGISGGVDTLQSPTTSNDSFTAFSLDSSIFSVPPVLQDATKTTEELLVSDALASPSPSTTISAKENVESKSKKNVESKKRKLSPSNVDNYMNNMSKLGEQIVATGQQIASALNPTMQTDQPLLESIAVTLGRIAESTENLANSSEKIASALKEIASAISNNQ